MANNSIGFRKILDKELGSLLDKASVENLGTKIEDFEIICEIGKGGFATVFKARCLTEGFQEEFVAIKKLNKQEILERKLKNRVISEIAIHRGLQNRSILKFHTFFHDKDYVYLVLDLCEHGSLEEYRKRKGHFSEKEACQVILQVIEGLKFLFANRIMHRDLSMKNILVSKDMKIKIADFGLATKINDEEEMKNSVLGTRNVMSPQVLQGKEYNIKSDCYSVGCILYALLYGTTPAAKSRVEFPKYASEEAQELLCALLEKDQDKRIDVKGVLKMPFFEKYKMSEHDSGMSLRSRSSALSSQSVKKSCRSTDSGFNNGTPMDFQNLQLSKSNTIPKRRDDHDNKPHRNGPRMEKAPFVKANKSKTTSSSSKQNMSKIILPSHFDPFRQITEAPFLPNHQEMCGQHMSNDRFDSELDDAPRDSARLYSFPSHRLKYAKEENDCFNSGLSGHNTVDMRNSHSHEQSKKMLRSRSQDSHLKSSSCSQCGTSEVKCSRENCRRHNAPGCSSRGNSCHSIKESKKEGIGVSNNDKSLKDIVKPLNTIRLLSRKHDTKNAIVSLLEDGQVCMEFLKWKRDKKYITSVWYISPDGLAIKLYKPKRNIEPSVEPHPLPNNLDEVQCFTLENLPKIHWKKYQSAKRFIDFVRSKTPKVTIYGKHCKCVMMENGPNPDFDARFYNGCMITEIENKVTFTNQEHQSADLAYKDLLSDDIKKMYKVFTKMKKKCKWHEQLHAPKKVEEDISDDEFSDNDKSSDDESSDDDGSFPMIFGRRRYHMLQFQNTSKQNVTPRTQQSSVLNGPISAMKSYNGTMNSGCSPSQNSFRKGIPSPSNSKNTIAGIKSFSEIMKDLKELPRVANGYVVAKYKDGNHMHSSLDAQCVYFSCSGNRLTNIEQNPELMARIQWDLPGVLLEALRTR